MGLTAREPQEATLRPHPAREEPPPLSHPSNERSAQGRRRSSRAVWLNPDSVLGLSSLAAVCVDADRQMIEQGVHRGAEGRAVSMSGASSASLERDNWAVGSAGSADPEAA